MEYNREKCSNIYKKSTYPIQEIKTKNYRNRKQNPHQEVLPHTKQGLKSQCLGILKFAILHFFK